MKRHFGLSAWAGVGLFLLVFQLFAQAPDSIWSRTFGGSQYDECRSVQRTSDGGYILAGWTYSYGAGASDFWLVKTGPCGYQWWSRRFGGSQDDWCQCVRQISDGGYIMSGRTFSFGVGTPDSANAWLVKTDANGDTLWTRVYGGSAGERSPSVQQTSDGGYVVGGGTYSFGAGDWDFWLVKTNANGDCTWSRTYGGPYHDEGCSVQQTLDGGYIMAGHTRSFGAGTPSCSNFWLVKTDANGDSLWSRTFGGSYDDSCRFVQQISDSGYILVGNTKSFGVGTPFYSNFWLVKTNANGDCTWSRTFGGSNNDHCNSVQQTSDGGYILAGCTHSYGVGGDFWLLKTDTNGDSLWSRTFGGSGWDGCQSAQQTSDGGYVMAGYTNSFGAGDYDFWLVKTAFESPQITSITDVGNDQGRQVRIRWYRSAYDDVCVTGDTITRYSIYRRIDQYLVGGGKKAERESLDWPPGEWEYIKTVPARGEAQYATIVPTLADSTSEGIYWSVFFVSAETWDPLIYFDSEVDSGYSIDNLPPDETILTAMAQPSPGHIHLRWQEVVTGGGGQPEQGDIWYHVYGSTDPMFTPAPENLLIVTQSLEFTHEVGANQKYFYIIQASDDH